MGRWGQGARQAGWAGVKHTGRTATWDTNGPLLQNDGILVVPFPLPPPSAPMLSLSSLLLLLSFYKISFTWVFRAPWLEPRVCPCGPGIWDVKFHSKPKGRWGSWVGGRKAGKCSFLGWAFHSGTRLSSQAGAGSTSRLKGCRIPATPDLLPRHLTVGRTPCNYMKNTEFHLQKWTQEAGSPTDGCRSPGQAKLDDSPQGVGQGPTEVAW